MLKWIYLESLLYREEKGMREMWKKVLLISICLISCSCIINLSLIDTLHAQSAPTFQLPKGSKVVLGTYDNREIVWDIGNNDNNGSYVLMSSKPITKMSTYDSSIPVTTTPQTGNDREDYCLRLTKGNSIFTYCPDRKSVV